MVCKLFDMTEELTTPSFCEVCGIDVSSNSNLKRFGKLFCSEGHMDQYVKSRQRRLGYQEEYEKNSEEQRKKKKGDGWRSFLRGCC